jgi:hypothetical protein
VSIGEQLLSQVRVAHEALVSSVCDCRSAQEGWMEDEAGALWSLAMSIAAMEEYEAALSQEGEPTRLTLDVVDVMTRWHVRIDAEREELLGRARQLCEARSPERQLGGGQE